MNETPDRLIFIYRWLLHVFSPHFRQEFAIVRPVPCTTRVNLTDDDR